VEPQAPLTRDGGKFCQRIDGSGAHRPGRADHHKRQSARGLVGFDFLAQLRGIDLLTGIRGNPRDRIQPQAEQVNRLVNPGVGFRGGVNTQPPRAVTAQAMRTGIPRQLGLAGGQKRHKVRHRAARHQHARGVGRVANHLCNPPNGLRFDLARHR